MLAGVADPGYRGEATLLLHGGCEEDYVQNTGEYLGGLLAKPNLAIKVSGKLRQPNSGRTANGPELKFRSPTR